MKRFLPVMLVCVLVFTLCLSGCSGKVSTNQERFSEDASAITDEISTLAAKAPKETGALPYRGTVLRLKAGGGAYTACCFSPNENQELAISGSLTPGGDQNEKSREAKIFLYEVGNDTCIDSYTISQFVSETSLSHTFINLDEDKSYYLFIQNTTSRGIFTSKTIDGIVEIS